MLFAFDLMAPAADGDVAFHDHANAAALQDDGIRAKGGMPRNETSHSMPAPADASA